MKHIYKTTGTCSRSIEIEIDNDIIKSIRFEGGCHGNTQGIARLAEGRNVDEVINALKGILCHDKPTSCPDQLATALTIIKQSGNKQ